MNGLKILSYDESIKKLHGLIVKFKEKIDGIRNDNRSLPFYSWLPLVSFSFALQAQTRVLEYLNDKHLNYGLAWDEDTGLPSLPSLVADVGSYIRHLNPQGGLRTILESFCGWTLLTNEEMICYCGSRSFKGQKVTIEIMLNHVLKIQESSIVIEQFLGVKSDNSNHLKHHYSFKKSSRRIDNLYMIWLCQNRIKNNGSLEIEYLESEQANEFNSLGFQNRILELTK